MTLAYRSVVRIALLCLFLIGVAWGQTYPADSQFTQSFGVDSINLQNLYVMIDVPILQKPGAIPFTYETAGASNCVIVGSAPNRHVYCGIGFRKVDAPGGNLNIRLSDLSPTDGWTLSGTSTAGTCSADGKAKTTVTNLTVVGPNGLNYNLPPADSYVSETGGTACISNLDDYTQQGGVHVVTNNASVTVTPPNGFTSTPTSLTDTFGNTISYNSSTQNITDTLGNAALNLGTANAWTYHDTGGTAHNITQVLSTSQTIKTAFGCSGIVDTSYAGNVVNEIDYPDGNNLLFTYEAVTGGITGRINQITYRTGGTATYTYGSIDCTNMMPTSITRTTVDGATTYTRALITGGSTTTVLDPGKNKTVYTFMYNGGGNPDVLTQVQTWQNTGTVGSPSYPTNANRTVLYCYNGNTTSCATTQPSYPIQYKDVYVTIDGKSTSSRTKYTYDVFTCNGRTNGCSLGNVLEIDRYPFTTLGAGTIDNKTVITYGSYNGSFPCASVGSGIVNLPCDVKTTDGGGTKTLAESRYTYGTKGFNTQTQVWEGSTWITTSAIANGNGTPASTTNALGKTTTYSYTSGCNSMLPTGTSVTLGTATLTTGATWDCNMGKLLTATDVNGNTSTFTYDLLGRQASQEDPANLYTLSESYPSATTATVTDSTYFTTTNTVDGLGRGIRSQTTDGSSYDTVSTGYGFNGTQWRVSTSQPCITTLGADCTKNHFADIDPLGRTFSTSTTGNETVASTYSQNDVSVNLSPAPSGENTKTVQTEIDGLGRVTSICALQATGGTSCGQFDGNSGILTTYAYSYNSTGTTNIAATRGSQTHTTILDQLGRKVFETLPESGSTTYNWDATTGVCGSLSYPGHLVETVDANGTHVCYLYDALGRLITTKLSNGTQCHDFIYGDQNAGTPMANSNGRIAEAVVDVNCNGGHDVDEWFAYDKDGRTTDVYETTPNSSGQYHTQASYFVNGQLNTISGVPGKSTYTITLDTNGRPDFSKYGTTTVARNVNWNAAGQATEIDYNSTGTDKDLLPRDANTGLMTGWTYNYGAASQTGALTWNTNRTLKKLIITDSANAANAQTCNYNPTDHTGTGYDDVGRLVGFYCGAAENQTYLYDQYDNFSKSGTTNWNPGYSATNNHITGASYDSDGQVTYDLNNSYAWDGYHKMITANAGASLGSCGAAGVTCVTYDAFGRAVEKNIAGTITELLYSPVGLTAIMSGQTTNSFRAPIPGGATFRAAANNAIYHADWLGSARLENTLSDSLVKSVAYTPYGETYANSGNGDLNFTGDYQDLFSGLYDTPNREFDTTSGSRWLSPDPARASWNAYAYPTNPNSFIDPSGLDETDTIPQSKRSIIGGVVPSGTTLMVGEYDPPYINDPLNIMGGIGSVPGSTINSYHTATLFQRDENGNMVPTAKDYYYTMSNGTTFVNGVGQSVGSGVVVPSGHGPVGPVRPGRGIPATGHHNITPDAKHWLIQGALPTVEKIREIFGADPFWEGMFGLGALGGPMVFGDAAGETVDTRGWLEFAETATLLDIMAQAELNNAAAAAGADMPRFIGPPHYVDPNVQ